MFTTKFKFNYAVGAIPNGIKIDTFTFFLLPFYSYIVGLNPALAGTAIFIALLFDAITDPLMGSISDRSSFKGGKRHPFMMVSFIPIMIGYVLLFAPREDWGLSQSNLFIWMTSFLILTRFGMTLFDIPHRAFGAEIIKDYSERTILMSWRELFQWIASLGNAALAYVIFFKSTDDYPLGQLNPDAWFPFALTGGFLMFLAVIYSTVSTKKYSKDLSIYTRSFSLADIIGELRIALTNKSFIILFFGNLAISIAWGMSNSLTFLVNTFFWELNAGQISFFLPIYLFSTVLAFVLTPKIVQKFDKRIAVMICILGVSIMAPMPLVCYLLGITPDKGTLSLVFFIGFFLMLLTMFAVMGNMTRDSMVGDIADEVQLKSKTRQEGILYAGVSFMQKVSTGVGASFAGFILAFINFPTGQSVNPNDEQVFSLILVQGPLGGLLLFIQFFIFYFYELDKNKHEKIMNKLN